MIPDFLSATPENIQVIGLIAAFLTTAAYVPQTLKTIRSRSTKDLAFSTFFMLFAGTIMWLIYGLYIDNKPLIFANIITSTLTGVILVLKVTEVRKRKKKGF